MLGKKPCKYLHLLPNNTLLIVYSRETIYMKKTPKDGFIAALFEIVKLSRSNPTFQQWEMIRKKEYTN